MTDDQKPLDAEMIQQRMRLAEQQLADAQKQVKDRQLDRRSVIAATSPGSVEEHAATRALDEAKKDVEQVEAEVERLRDLHGRATQAEANRLETRRLADVRRGFLIARSEYVDAVAADWIAEGAKKERRLLLGVATAGWLIVLTGLIPTEITALGITFSETERSSLLVGLSAVSAYLTIAFVTHTWRDRLQHRSRVERARHEVDYGAELLHEAAGDDDVETWWSRDDVVWDLGRFLGWARLVDWWLPIGLGGGATVALLARAIFG